MSTENKLYRLIDGQKLPLVEDIYSRQFLTEYYYGLADIFSKKTLIISLNITNKQSIKMFII